MMVLQGTGFGVLDTSRNYQSSAPQFYVLKDTWHETMLASQESLAQHCDSTGKKLEMEISPWYRTKPIDDVSIVERDGSREFDPAPFIKGQAAEILFLDGVDLNAKDENGKPKGRQLRAM